MKYRKWNINDIDIKSVDPEFPAPLYQQVRIDLMSLLRSGKLSPGDMLPSEGLLAEKYGVSRQTLRKAIDYMVNRNLLERTAGRGTVVLKWEDRLIFFLDRSFAKQINELGFQPHSEVLRKEDGVIDETSAMSLQGKIGSPSLELFRIRYGSKIPIGVQYTTIVTELCPDLSQYDFSTSSLYDLLVSKYRLPVSRIDHIVGASVADEWMRSLLKVNELAPLLLVKTTAYLNNGDPIEATTSYYRADLYEFSISQDF